MTGSMICGCDIGTGCYYHGCSECHGGVAVPHTSDCSIGGKK